MSELEDKLNSLLSNQDAMAQVKAFELWSSEIEDEEVAAVFAEYAEDEGLHAARLLEMLNKITEGRGTMKDLDALSTLGKVIKDTALCGLGQTSPNPVLSTLNNFYDEYVEHVRDKTCRAKQCKALLTYTINPELCIGCHLCFKHCPADAILGDVRKPHVINPDKCIKCGMCMARCKFKAINVC